MRSSTTSGLLLAATAAFTTLTSTSVVVSATASTTPNGASNNVNNVVTTSSLTSSGSPSLTYESLTKPLPLYPGEVTNTWHHIAIPPGPIAISEFAADIVEKDPTTGELIPVPLSEAYLHHHVVYSEDEFYKPQHKWWSPMKSTKRTTVNRGVGFGAGTESRGTRQVFPYPYRFTTVKGEDELIANVHVINTRTMTIDQAHHCLECPCTAQDYAPLETSHHFHWPWSSSKKSLTNRDVTSEGESQLSEEVIERRHHWDRCNAQLMNESNTACSPDLYYGGLICCEHGEFCLDNYYLDSSLIAKPDKKTHMRASNPKIGESQSVFYLRYSLTYQPLTVENTTDIRPLYLAACCDATGNLTSTGNIEYDIPKLCEGDENCTHVLATVQELHGASDTAFGTSAANKEVDEWVDVVYMVGHLHRGGMEMSAYYANNDTLLCQSLPQYGNGAPKQIGNEPGYINAMSTCTFDPPLRMKTTTKLKIVGKYHANESHTGVMSLFYIALSDVLDATDGTATASINNINERGFFGRFQSLAIFAAFAIVVMASIKVYKKQQLRRDGYEQINNMVV